MEGKSDHTIVDRANIAVFLMCSVVASTVMVILAENYFKYDINFRDSDLLNPVSLIRIPYWDAIAVFPTMPVAVGLALLWGIPVTCLIERCAASVGMVRALSIYCLLWIGATAVCLLTYALLDGTILLAYLGLAASLWLYSRVLTWRSSSPAPTARE